MLVVMDKSATPEQIQAVVEKIERLGMKAEPIPGGQRTSVCVLQNTGAVDPTIFAGMPGVMESIRVSKPFKLVSRETHRDDSEFDVSGVPVGGKNLTVIAGPCSVESYEQTLETAKAVKAAGAHMLRGGAFKPRTSPYSFQGLGEEGLKILARVREETGMPIVTEAIDHEVCDVVEEYADMIQIGTRNMQNYTLLRRAGRAKIPVLLKRGMSATYEEWLMAAEYIMSEGNRRVILCERGVRTFADHLRNTLDLSVVPFVQRITHLPVFVDPSHGAGNRDMVDALSFGAVAVGARGLIIEVHNNPPSAMSDGAQSLWPEQFAKLMKKLPRLAEVLAE
ncbi:3-deoxy-7-phosphoheptulonate synthase [bacterium]|nr:3-deoxy-7-phosphoheptulonate synthase [bacterium]